METKEPGYCIYCGTPIKYNVASKVYCDSCLNNSDAVKKRQKGNFCHTCKNTKSIISIEEPRCRDCRPFDSGDNTINDYYIEQVNKYKSLSLSERKRIKPKWDDPNSSTIEIEKLHPSEWGFNLFDIFENEPKDVRRTLNILRAWEKGVRIEVPSLNGKTERIDEGRHRIMALLYLQERTTPIKLVFR